jgi:ABC-type transport system involved in cytochrome c biogenesis permease subunit
MVRFMTDREFLWLAEFFFVVSGVLTWLRWQTNEAASRLHRSNYLAMLAGFGLQTAFLYLRGLAVGRCPLTNAFETTVFVTWGATLFYLLIGPSYRVSFLGAFTAPLVLAISAVALLGLDDTPRLASLKHSPWVDFHAAIGILATGAFALAAVIAGMYLRQERQLKSHHPGRTFFLLPAIEQLEVIGGRLIILGFALLTVGMAGGVVSVHKVGPWTPGKTAWSVAVWLAYGALLMAQMTGTLRGRRLARTVIVLFVLLLVTFWLVGLLPEPPKP